MATLTPDHRAVSRGTSFRGLSVAESAAEAGKVLGAPAGTAISRTAHALRALKQAVGQRGVKP